jgi:phosphoribosyl-ATP pyrophosphohydrolase
MAKPGVASPKAKPKTAPGKAKAKIAPLKRKRVGSSAVASDDRLQRLWDAVQEVRDGRRTSPRTARLLAAGAPKMAQKVVEEAAEVAIEAVQGRRDAMINESVDLLYNLAALWNGAGVRLDDLWAEMDRREAAFGMSEKLPKTDDV